MKRVGKGRNEKSREGNKWKEKEILKVWKVKVIGEIRKGNYLHHCKLKWETSNITDRQKKSITNKNASLN